MTTLLALPKGCEIRCRACAHRALSAEESQSQKLRWLEGQLAPWKDKLAPLQAAPEQQRWAYRNKVCLSTAWAQGSWQFGLISRKELIPIPRCPVHAEPINRTVQWLTQSLPPASRLPLAYYLQSGAQATLVLKTNQFPELSWLGPSLQTGLSAAGIEGLWLHLHPSAGRRVTAKKAWHLVWGRPRSRDADGLVYGPTAFQQLLPSLYRCALDQAEAFLAPSPRDAVVDLYCGIGSSLRRWTRRGARAVGVELDGEAVECAKLNAPGALLLRGRCSQRIPQLGVWLAEPECAKRLLYVNPPRTGLEPQVRDWIARQVRPSRMVYLSCSAGTLGRDLEHLEGAGYRAERISPYDFFPQTHHVETLTCLQRL